MSSIKKIQDILKEGFIMIDNIDYQTTTEYGSLEYVESAQTKLKEAGVLVHNLTPAVCDMIQFVHANVPVKYHGNINHAWSGIGEWQA